MLWECCAPLGRSLLHTPTARVASAAQMGRGGQAKAGRQGCLESVNFLLQFSLLPEPEGGLTRLAGEPLCLGGWRGCCADLLAAVRRAWSCAGPCRAKARTAARSHFEGFWALGELPVRCHVPGLYAERAPARTLVSADLVTRPGSKNISGPLIEKWGLLRGRDFRMCVQFQRDPDSGVTIATSAHCIPGCWAGVSCWRGHTPVSGNPVGSPVP